MKKGLSMLLTLLMATQMTLTTPLATFATSTANYKEEAVTWMGNSADYSKTLKTVFDRGLRKIIVGEKWGLVDTTGTFVAPPIYDAIAVRLSANDEWSESENESIFVDGYVQVVRNEKEGLLNTNGEEVIPCKYDQVWLPVEGVCRLVSNNKLGYWNLESNKEIVAPKYNLGVCKWLEEFPWRSYETIVRTGENGKKIDTHPAWFDFNEGYALVPVSDAGKLGINGQIIDKNGKEILKSAYPFRALPATEHEGMHLKDYPQKGPYLVFQVYSTERLTIVSDQHYKVAVPAHLKNGLVGPKGIVVAANYHGNIGTPEKLSYTGHFVPGKPDPKGDPKDYIHVSYSQMHVFPAFSMVVTYDAPQHDSQNFDSYNRNHSLVKFNGTVIPNIARARYDAVNDVVIASDFKKNLTYVFYKNGTMKTYPNYDFGDSMIPNHMKGYINFFVDPTKSNPNPKQYLVSIPAGKKSSYAFNHITSFISTAGTIWVQNDKHKYGLIRASDGKALTPFEYDEVDSSRFGSTQAQITLVKKGDQFGIVDQNGKTTVPAKYSGLTIQPDAQCTFSLGEDYSVGRLNALTGKIIIPSVKDSKVAYTNNRNLMILETGSRPMTLEDVGGDARLFRAGDRVLKYRLTDLMGNPLTDEYEKFFDPINGLIILDAPAKKDGPNGSSSQAVGEDGKFVCPPSLVEDAREYKVAFVVADGKFGCVSASALSYSNEPKFPKPKTR